MKVRIVVQPTGLLNGAAWPEAGETMDLPDSVAESMLESGHVEPVKHNTRTGKTEKRPASESDVEKRDD